MKPTLVQPYLFFGGRCEEALEFYRTALGAQVDFLMRYKESPEPMPPGMLPPGFENKVMHATFRITENILMASDGSHEGAKFDGFSLSLAVPTEAEAKRAFAALSAGGQVENAADQDVLVAMLWHAHGSFWHRLDGERSGLNGIFFAHTS